MIAIRLVLRLVDLILVVPLRIAATVFWNLLTFRSWLRRKRFVLGESFEERRSR